MAEQVLTFENERLNHELNRLVVYCKCDTTKSTWTTAVINHRIDGEIVCVDTKPGATAPKNLYDPTLKNVEGIDPLGGALDDRSSTLAQRVYPSYFWQQAYHIVPAPVEGCLSIEMANNDVQGADWNMYIYYRKKETARG